MSVPPITGSTQLVGAMGWPAVDTAFLRMINAALVAGEVTAVCVPLTVPPEQLEGAVRGLVPMGFLGCEIDGPHQLRIFRFLDRLTPEAEVIGAVDSVRIEEDGSITGHNVACRSAVRALERDGAPVRGRSVVVLGAGPSARTAATGCAFAGADRVIVLDSTPAPARALVEDLSSRIRFDDVIEWEAGEFAGAMQVLDWSRIDFVIKAAGGGADEAPIDSSLPMGNCRLLDMEFALPDSVFLRSAHAKGLRCSDRLDMLLELAAASYEFWLGQRPNCSVLRQALLQN